MSSEIAPMIRFKKVPRCYRTEQGWRLATYEEARDNLDMIKEQQLLKDWERARLLNGWISGPRYNFEMGDGYRGSIGYMLVIESGGSENELYADVNLDRAAQEMALLLCSEDWNYEVVYWVLNSFAETEAAKMDASDVRGGNIPFPDTRLFVELNKMVNDFARMFGDSPASEIAVNEEFSPRSIKEVLLSMWSSCWNKLDASYKKRLGRLWNDRIVWSEHDLASLERSLQDKIEGKVHDIIYSSEKLDWLPNFASQGDVSDAIKNFTWEYLSSQIISKCAHRSLDLLIIQWSKFICQPLTTAQKNFLVSTRILCHLSFYKGYFQFEKVDTILNEARGKHVEGDVEHFKRKLRDGSYWHVYDTENYNALEKALFVAASKGWNDPIMMNKMLDYGAQPLCKLKKNTVLHWAVRYFNSEDEVNHFAERLFAKCNAKEQLANANNDSDSTNFGKGLFAKYRKFLADSRLASGTALHLASERGFARTCELLLRSGGKPDVQDKDGQIPLHRAVMEGKDEVIDVLVRRGENDEPQSQDAPDINQNRIDMVNFIDKKGESPLDIAVRKNNMKVVAKLVAVSEQPVEYYFDKVGGGKLLRQFALDGNRDMVEKLLKSKAKPDEVDEEGKTFLHYLAMSEDDGKADYICYLILGETPAAEREKLVAMRDLKGRTALHLAAEKGHTHLSFGLLRMKKGLQSMKDQDGQSPIHYAVKGNHHKADVIDIFSEGGIDDNLVDHTGLTPLHVAATAANIFIADALIRYSEDPKSYVKKPDFLGQTALHKACKEGHIDTIKVLLHWGAEPLLERDCDGRTALHYAVQTPQTDKRMAVVQLLLKRFKSEEEKLLFLWASAAGLGTADENLYESPLKNFLQKQKEDLKQSLGKETNLTRIAASNGDIEMTKELLTRGGEIADIEDQTWKNSLSEKEKPNVEKVLKQIQSIAEQGNDQPTMDDNLGRYDFASGLAALFLNPCLKPPVNVGISGDWGKGKSSLMKQTEIMLLKTRAQLVLLPSSQLSTSDFPGAKTLELSRKGGTRIQEIQRQIKLLENPEMFKGDSFVTRMKKMFQGLMKRIRRWKTTEEKSNKKDERSLFHTLNNYEVKYHNIFKSLARMDASYMFTKAHDSPMEESVPAVLTVQYNAWKYRNDKEALAGMAVEITREMEKTMTMAQWISTSWRNTWKKQKQDIWMKLIFPSILAVFLAGAFTCIVWLLLDRYKFKRSAELKYACLPVTILITVWTLVKSVLNTVNPVSTQLMKYIQFPDDHVENLGYQERVISDIEFLKGEVGRQPFLLFAIPSYIWDLVNAFCAFLCLESFGEVKVFNASVNPRIIVFVDDLDRCHESVILQVLSAINLVLAVCEISVVVGMDKALIERAIIKMYEDENLKGYETLKGGEELADQYLQKIIQLPLDLPEPDPDQSKKFLERQLGVFEKQRMDKDQNEKSNDEEEDEDYNALFREKDRNEKSNHEEEDELLCEKRKVEEEDELLRELDSEAYNISSVDVMKKLFCPETLTPKPDTNISEESKSRNETNTRENTDVVISMDASGEKVVHSSEETGEAGQDPSGAAGQNPSNIDIERDKIILIKKMLFVRYSEGERDAFCYFQPFATGCRKLPREWKRFLNYHRLVWNIFFMSDEAKELVGWQVQLITWIFICWEWQENINYLIEKWNTFDILKTSRPSLKEIIADIIEKKRWLSKENMPMNSNKEEANKILMYENKEMSANIGMSSKKEGAMKEKEDTKEQEDSAHGMLEGAMKEKEDTKEQEDSAHGMLKKVVKEIEELKDKFKETESEFVKEIKELKDKFKETESEFVKEIKELKDKFKEIESELKDQGTKNKGQKSEKIVETDQMQEKNWKRLKSTLDRYNVTMDGIQAFQRFRFYCIASHLQWPFPKEDF